MPAFGWKKDPRAGDDALGLAVACEGGVGVGGDAGAMEGMWDMGEGEIDRPSASARWSLGTKGERCGTSEAGGICDKERMEGRIGAGMFCIIDCNCGERGLEEAVCGGSMTPVMDWMSGK